MKNSLYKLDARKKAEPIKKAEPKGTEKNEPEKELQYIIQQTPDLLLREKDMSERKYK